MAAKRRRPSKKDVGVSSAAADSILGAASAASLASTEWVSRLRSKRSRGVDFDAEEAYDAEDELVNLGGEEATEEPAPGAPGGLGTDVSAWLKSLATAVDEGVSDLPMHLGFVPKLDLIKLNYSSDPELRFWRPGDQDQMMRQWMWLRPHLDHQRHCAVQSRLQRRRGAVAVSNL